MREGRAIEREGGRGRKKERDSPHKEVKGLRTSERIIERNRERESE